jgi:hypothetical protein
MGFYIFLEIIHPTGNFFHFSLFCKFFYTPESKMKLGACIKLVKSTEPVTQAITSILELPKGTIDHLYVESPNGQGTLQVSKEDYRRLIDLGITVQDIGGLDEQELPKCEAIVFIPPECRFTPTGFHKLTHAMETTRNTRITHYSVTSQTVLKNLNPWDGFLIINFLIDWLWAFPWFRIPQDYHLRAVYVITIGKRRFLAQRRWFWSIWGVADEMCVNGKSAVQSKFVQTKSFFVTNHVCPHTQYAPARR